MSEGIMWMCMKNGATNIIGHVTSSRWNNLWHSTPLCIRLFLSYKLLISGVTCNIIISSFLSVSSTGCPPPMFVSQTKQDPLHLSYAPWTPSWSASVPLPHLVCHTHLPSQVCLSPVHPLQLQNTKTKINTNSSEPQETESHLPFPTHTPSELSSSIKPLSSSLPQLTCSLFSSQSDPVAHSWFPPKTTIQLKINNFI